MLHKSRDLEGRAILASSTGAVVGHCKGVVFDADGRRVLALLADEGGWLRGAKVVAFERIASIGETAIMVDTPDAVAPAKGDDAIEAALERKSPLIGLPLVNVRGDAVGRIADMIFEFPAGEVRQIEIKSGLIADLASGRQVIDASDAIRIGADSGVVPDAVLAVARHEGGMQQVVQSAGHRVGELAASVGATAAEAAGKARDKLGEATESTRESVARGLDRAEATFDDLRTRAGAALDEAGERAGQTYDEVKARTASTYDEVRAKAGSAYDEVREKAGTAYDEARDKAGAAYEEVRDKAGTVYYEARVKADAGTADVRSDAASGAKSLAAGAAGLAATLGARAEGLLGKARHWAADKRETVEGQLDERSKARQAERDAQRIRASLGRPVNRVILAPDDMIILPAGGIVTNLAVQTARERGVLDLLLDSVDLDANLAGYAQTPADPDNPEWSGGKLP